jgi:hypothetical protein
MTALSIFLKSGAEIAAGSTGFFKFQLLDENDVAVPLADLSALTLTLVATSSKAVINSVSDSNIMNTGRIRRTRQC